MHLLWHCTISQLILTYSCGNEIDTTWEHVSYLRKVLLDLFGKLGGVVVHLSYGYHMDACVTPEEGPSPSV